MRTLTRMSIICYEIKQRFIDEVTQIPGVTVNGKTGRDSAPQIVSVTESRMYAAK